MLTLLENEIVQFKKCCSLSKVSFSESDVSSLLK